MDILDSGNRTEFETGAVRDLREGKGRYDLIPWEFVSKYATDGWWIEKVDHTYHKKPCAANFELLSSLSSCYCQQTVEAIIADVGSYMFDNTYDMINQLAIHFENGCKKYGERNWEKGIPCHCYIDSAIRHYTKWMFEHTDENHAIAFIWNLVCLMWTAKYKKECIDIGII